MTDTNPGDDRPKGPPSHRPNDPPPHPGNATPADRQSGASSPDRNATPADRRGDVPARSGLPSERDDPRFDEHWFRSVPASSTGGAVTLVGVVHDHPASVARVAETVSALDPDVVALELPSLAVPWFERRAAAPSTSTAAAGESAAADGGTPAASGEMTAAIRAGSGATVVGIDAPDRRFAAEFLAYVRDERPALGTIRSVLEGVAPIFVDAVRYRIRSVVESVTGRARASTDSGSFDAASFAVSASDAPATQAADESTQFARSRSLLSAVDLPPSVATLDALRESTMAHHLAALRRDGEVVAVLGCDHLDGVAEALEETEADAASR